VVTGWLRTYILLHMGGFGRLGKSGAVAMDAKRLLSRAGESVAAAVYSGQVWAELLRTYSVPLLPTVSLLLYCAILSMMDWSKRGNTNIFALVTIVQRNTLGLQCF